VDLVLTPQYYTMKRDDLPVRFAMQARKLAPAILEEAGDPETLRYEVLRQEEGWLYLAYDPREVARALREKGLAPERIGRLYFAQQLEAQLQEPALLPGGEYALHNLEGTVTILPSSLLDPPPSRSALSLPLPQEAFRFPLGETHTALLGRRQALWLVVAALLLGGAWLLEGIRDTRQAGNLEENLSAELAEYPTLQSRLARQNILEKYRKIDRRERQIRDRIQALGTLTSKETRLNSLTIDETGYQASIELPASKRNTLTEMAREAGLKVERSDRELELKGAWQ